MVIHTPHQSPPMKYLATLALTLAVCAAAHAADDTSSRITPQIQLLLDAQKRTIATWAANPRLVSAVRSQNGAGPDPAITPKAWKKAVTGSALLDRFEKNAAGKWLSAKVSASNGLYREAFLSAARGEKVAFVEKPSHYLHARQKKFEVPMTGRVWQGKPEFDKSSHSHVTQIAVPVVSGGKPIGVLVVGVSMKALRDLSRR